MKLGEIFMNALENTVLGMGMVFAVLIIIIIVIALASGIAMMMVGEISPYLFCATFLVFAIMEACVRPYSTNILLSQQEGDTGAASSLINFAHTAIGCAGMVLAVLPWPNYIVGVGAIIVLSMAVAAISWFALLRSGIPLIGVKDADPSAPAHPATAAKDRR